MKTVWRLTQANTIERALNGEGARQYGGRWNQKGTPVVYTAATLSLCVLEILVHVDSDLFPKFYAFKIGVPEDVKIAELDQTLPKNWRQTPPPEELQDMGTLWAKTKNSVLLRIPSAIIPKEFNFLINPHHPDFDRLKIDEPELFELDPRLKIK